MLTSISPLGERARGQRHGLTVAAHLVGGLLGGDHGRAARRPRRAAAAARAPALAAAVCLAAAVTDLRGLRLGRGQVDED